MTTVDVKPGERMTGGIVYAGDLGSKEIYTTPEDAPRTYTFNEAARYAEQLNAQKYLGYDDWRVPSLSELSLLFKNSAAIGGFNLLSSTGCSRYRSSEAYNRHLAAMEQNFADGEQRLSSNLDSMSLRCVRG